MLVFHLENFEAIEKNMGQEKAASLVHDLHQLVAESLRRRSDAAVEESGAILVVLPGTARENALMVAGRIRQIFDDYLSEQGLENQVEIACSVATYPEDGESEEKLFTKAGVR